MPKAGQVRVYLTRRMAADTAAWLSNVYVPPPLTALGGSNGADQELQIERALRLAAILQKGARRRRSGEDFVCLIETELATWCGRKCESLAITRNSLAADNDPGFIHVQLSCSSHLRGSALRREPGEGGHVLLSQGWKNVNPAA